MARNGYGSRWSTPPSAAAVAHPHACSYPLTAKGVVKRVYTDLAVLEVTPRGFAVRDMIPGLTREALQARTEATLIWDQA